MKWFTVLAAALCASSASGTVIVEQLPVSGGGVARSSQLWQDPGPNGNDLDSDAICWEDFTLGAQTAIGHIEWWGTGACELGFQIEIWRQDPGTMAYQPLAVFDGVPGIEPEARFVATTFTVSAGPGGILHYSLDLETPIILPANDAVNPRWFIGIIGWTAQPFVTWNWAQGTGGSNRTFQWVRGLHMYRSLPEGRAMVLATPTFCFGDANGDSFVSFPDITEVLANWNTAYSPGTGPGDANGDSEVNFSDITSVLSNWGTVCP